jgi:hypothetical protein
MERILRYSADSCDDPLIVLIQRNHRASQVGSNIPPLRGGRQIKIWICQIIWTTQWRPRR